MNGSNKQQRVYSGMTLGVVAHQEHKNNWSLVNVVHIFSRFFTKPASVDGRKEIIDTTELEKTLKKTLEGLGQDTYCSFS